MQVATSPCCQRDFPDVILRILPEMLEPVPRRSSECICLVLPQSLRPSPTKEGSAFPLLSANTIFHGPCFEAAAISLCSSLPACLPSRSFLPLQILLQGSQGFYLRAERVSLPSHASDTLSARLQAIGGTRTCTSLDSQPCRLLTFAPRPLQPLPRYYWPVRHPLAFLPFPGVAGYRSDLLQRFLTGARRASPVCLMRPCHRAVAI